MNMVDLALSYVWEQAELFVTDPGQAGGTEFPIPSSHLEEMERVSVVFILMSRKLHIFQLSRIQTGGGGVVAGH